MQVCHYTHADKWFDIKESGSLRPTAPLGTVDRNAWNCRALFCLLEATPANWLHNPHFPDIWKRLTKDIGNILLDVFVPDDNAYVIERGHMQGYLDLDKTRIPPQFLHADRGTAEKFYAASKVPINEYTYDYVLPEVIICDPIDLKNIKVSDLQPLFEAQYTSCEYFCEQESLLRQIRNINELQPWIAKQSSSFQQELEKVTKKYERKRSFRLV